ncbi:heat shock 75 mitochondrial [Labeo rohita]|uniref:Heat shock 75 mitochondrial n=1 Tax=Labeo rohita TaxID=84645 RepID=A0A498LWZ5_LABRO|nr:heat shock 75 mitochondrial [Labeo rohita]RXN12761.1 heat shock 75 mitochondrial [Labeo rohita]
MLIRPFAKITRELISNSSDALEKLRHKMITAGGDTAPMEIHLQTDAAKGTFTIQDADLGTRFQQLLEASPLAPVQKEIISAWCLAFLKEVLAQYQKCLPASMEMLRKLELLSPKIVMSTINRP